MTFELFVINFVFVVISTLLVLRPIKHIMSYNLNGIVDYVAVIVYGFNVVPVLLDLILGIPSYNAWYSNFSNVLTDFSTCLIYNAYLSLFLFFCWIISSKSISKDKSIRLSTSFDFGKKRIIDYVIIVLPLVLPLVLYGFSFFSGYKTVYGRTGNSSFDDVLNQLIMLAIFVCLLRFFSKKRNALGYFSLFVYLFLLTWVNGKRYIIAIIALCLMFVYQSARMNSKKRLNLWVSLPILVLIIVAFSSVYVTTIKVTDLSSVSAYSTLRIDFGRDDVTKFVIKNCLIENKSILDYPGQSFLSTVFWFVPRELWNSKPWPHYRYLTAAIFNTTTDNIPSGITPSLFEMSIANFGYFGMIIPFFAVWFFNKWCNSTTKLETKVLILMIMTVLLTQSIGVISYLVLFEVIVLVSRRLVFEIEKKRALA